MSAATDDLRALAERSFAAPFEGVIRIEPHGEPGFDVDGWSSPPRVVDASGPAPEGEARCVIRAGRDTLLRVLESERLFAAAFVAGRLVIRGDMSVVARAELGS